MANTKSCLAKDWILDSIRYSLVFDPAADHRSGEFLAGAQVNGFVGCGAGIFCPNLKLPRERIPTAKYPRHCPPEGVALA